MGSMEKCANMCFFGGDTWQYEKNWQKPLFYVELETQF